MNNLKPFINDNGEPEKYFMNSIQYRMRKVNIHTMLVHSYETFAIPNTKLCN